MKQDTLMLYHIFMGRHLSRYLLFSLFLAGLFLDGAGAGEGSFAFMHYFLSPLADQEPYARMIASLPRGRLARTQRSTRNHTTSFYIGRGDVSQITVSRTNARDTGIISTVSYSPLQLSDFSVLASIVGWNCPMDTRGLLRGTIQRTARRGSDTSIDVRMTWLLPIDEETTSFEFILSAVAPGNMDSGSVHMYSPTGAIFDHPPRFFSLNPLVASTGIRLRGATSVDLRHTPEGSRMRIHVESGTAETPDGDLVVHFRSLDGIQDSHVASLRWELFADTFSFGGRTTNLHGARLVVSPDLTRGRSITLLGSRKHLLQMGIAGDTCLLAPNVMIQVPPNEIREVPGSNPRSSAEQLLRSMLRR